MSWDYQQTEYDKQAEADPVWHLERMVNYGLDGRKINRSLLEKHFAQIRIPEDRRAFLELLLWNKKF